MTRKSPPSRDEEGVWPKAHITKIDAVRRQLETSIFLLFSDEDQIAIHTITKAAWTIIVDLLRHRGIDSLMDIYVKPEFKRQAKIHFNRAANFFKHADKDPDLIFEKPFNYETNEYALMMAIRDYSALVGQTTPVMSSFFNWFLLCYPHLVNDDMDYSPEYKIADLSLEFKKLDREHLLEAGLMMYHKHRQGQRTDQRQGC
jgi:hypothetical protein